MKTESKSGALGLHGASPGLSRGSSKYSRACKDNAKALVALVVAEENFNVDKGSRKHKSPRAVNSISSSAAAARRGSLERLRLLCAQVSREGPLCFTCLRCVASFNDYGALKAHQRASESCRGTLGMSLPFLKEEEEGCEEMSRLLEGSPSLDHYLSSSLKSVPECSLNHLDGRIQEIKTLDGEYLQRNPKIRTVNAVKLNLSGPWEAREVWTSAWEPGGPPLLSWEAFCPLSLSFLRSLSAFGWSEQLLLKRSFSSWLKRNTGTSREESEEWNNGHRGTAKRLPPHLQLKPSSSSSLSPRRTRKQRRGGGAESAPSTVTSPSVFSGEWELTRTYVCSVCSSTFEDLEDVMHHKWEEHPYCLVSHWSLCASTGLPPLGMYPQCGGPSLHNPREPSYRTSLMTCSLCGKGFSERDNFYVHLLGCGEASSTSMSSSTSSFSHGESLGRRRSSRVGRGPIKDEEQRRAERERRRRRLEAFSKPRPLSRRLASLRSRSSGPPVASPPLIVSNGRENEAILDVFHPGELFVKSLLSEILEEVLKGRRRRRGRPPKSLKRKSQESSSTEVDRRKSRFVVRSSSLRRRERPSRHQKEDNPEERTTPPEAGGLICSSINSCSSSSSSSCSSSSSFPPFFARKSAPFPEEEENGGGGIFFAVKSSPLSQNASESEEEGIGGLLLPPELLHSESPTRNEFVKNLTSQILLRRNDGEENSSTAGDDSSRDSGGRIQEVAEDGGRKSLFSL